MRTRLPTSTKLSPAQLALGYISSIERPASFWGKRTNRINVAPGATALATFARAMPRDRTDQPPGNTINSPTIDGWWTPQRNLNTPALSAVNVTVVSWPRLTVKLIS
jgi:hypothetical protein